MIILGCKCFQSYFSLFNHLLRSFCSSLLLFSEIKQLFQNLQLTASITVLFVLFYQQLRQGLQPGHQNIERNCSAFCSCSKERPNEKLCYQKLVNTKISHVPMQLLKITLQIKHVGFGMDNNYFRHVKIAMCVWEGKAFQTAPQVMSGECDFEAFLECVYSQVDEGYHKVSLSGRWDTFPFRNNPALINFQGWEVLGGFLW